MKIPKTLKQEWRIHLAYIVGFTMMVAFGLLLWSYREIKALRLTSLDAQQSLVEFKHTFGIWESQIESGFVEVVKRDGDTEVIERWRMEKETK